MEKKKINCKKCNFSTIHLGNWQKHLKTKKHNLNLYECECGKSFKYRQGLQRHEKTCVNISNFDKDKLLIETLNKVNNTLKEVKNISTTNIGIQNNTNIMIYLNNSCSNAISIQDFSEHLSLTDVDLKRLKSDKTLAIANILKQNLEPLSKTSRPIHNTSCEDWYIKDKIEGWQEDNGEKIVKNVENGIIKNWSKVFEELNPDWIKNNNSQKEYIELTDLATSGIDDKTQKEIIKKIKGPTFL